MGRKITFPVFRNCLLQRGYSLNCRGLICRCSKQLLISCSNGCFLECSPPSVEARNRFPAEKCQSRDIQFRMEMTLVKSLHSMYLMRQSSRFRQNNSPCRSRSVGSRKCRTLFVADCGVPVGESRPCPVWLTLNRHLNFSNGTNGVANFI